LEINAWTFDLDENKRLVCTHPRNLSYTLVVSDFFSDGEFTNMGIVTAYFNVIFGFRTDEEYLMLKDFLNEG